MLVRIHIIWKYLHGFTSILVGTWINHKITTILFIPSAQKQLLFSLLLYIAIYKRAIHLTRYIGVRITSTRIGFVLFTLLKTFVVCAYSIHLMLLLLNLFHFSFNLFHRMYDRYLLAWKTNLTFTQSFVVLGRAPIPNDTFKDIHSHKSACTLYSTQYYNAIRSKNNAWNCSIMYHWHSPDFIHICIIRSFSIVWVNVYVVVTA